MYIPASASTLLQTARGSPMSCSSSTAAAEMEAASAGQYSRHPSLALRLQAPGARRSGFPGQQKQQPKAKPAYSPPPIVRKDSGEIVRPCLRKRSATVSGTSNDLACERRSASPGASLRLGLVRTPRFVHFGADLECVRWFLKAQSPKAVCEDAMLDYCSQSEDEAAQQMHCPVAPTLRLTPIRRPAPSFTVYEDAPVVLERVELAAGSVRGGSTAAHSSSSSSSSAALEGSVKVHNLAFEKSVIVRYSFDQWRSVHQVDATYSRSLLEPQAASGRPGVDRFVFTMPVPPTIALPAVVALCVCYKAAGAPEHWDNNGGANYLFRLCQPAVPAIVDHDVDAVPTRRRMTFGSPQPAPTFAAPTAADTRRYMAQSAALFGSSNSAQPATATATATASTLPPSSSMSQVNSNSSASRYHLRHSPPSMPALPLYQDVAWGGGSDFAASYMATGASSVATIPSDYLSPYARPSSPLAAPVRTGSPIRHPIFDSDAVVRAGSPLAWAHGTTPSMLQC
ncbi:hypothetical protein GGI07_002257 [Coemansia sp. Benny D115]|nr:hypothetical protein GGI07_002257 [Coemansia sp. Benny D115]